MNYQRLLGTIAPFLGVALAYGQMLDHGNLLGTVQTRVVTGAPFTAEVETESTQILPDGNRIIHHSIARIARDSEGRTRREQGFSSGDASVVFIQDPVLQTTFVLETRSRSARRTAMPEPKSSPSSAQSVKSESLVGPTLSSSSDAISESLGTQIMEGVQVEGTRLIRTIPPKLAGNERSIQIELESWYSEELQTIIMTRTNDPRIGLIVYRLTNIERSEPPHFLFEVPTDYTIRVEPGVPDTRDGTRAKDK